MLTMVGLLHTFEDISLGSIKEAKQLIDEQYARFQSTQECPREDCSSQGQPFTIDTENYDEPRVVWACEKGHVFSTNLTGQDAHS